MKRLKVALVSYSYGNGNGIARIDESIVTGVHAHDIDISLFVIRADFPKGCIKNINGSIHINLIDAFYLLYKKFLDIDIVQFNGAFDPVACNAAVCAGVPAIIEVMHQVETGAMSECVDIVVCVSDIVKNEQTHRNLIVIENGIDCSKFSLKKMVGGIMIRLKLFKFLIEVRNCM